MEYDNLAEWADDLKRKETEYYEKTIERIETLVRPLFLKAFNHELRKSELELLQRQLQQALAAYEYGLNNDKFVFAIQQVLGERLRLERTKVVQNLKNALTIVDTKLKHKQASSEEDKEKMNYYDIVLEGYFDQNTREFLSKYFSRESRKAEKDFYEPSEFFAGCFKVLDHFEDYLKARLHERKKELYLMMDLADSRKLKYSEDDSSKTYEQRCKETKEYCEAELKEIGLGNFTVHLFSITKGKYAYNMWYDEVLYIKTALQEAYDNVLGLTMNKHNEGKQGNVNNYLIDLEYFESADVLKYKKAFEGGNGAVITDNGFQAKIWTAELFAILTNSTLPLEGGESINGRDFVKVYFEGYKEGMEYFKNEFSVTQNVLYTNPELYVNNLHVCYLHKEPINKKYGWIKWKESYPFIINDKAIKDYGFYAGVLFELYRLIEKHPVVFKDFDKCKEINEADKEGREAVIDEGNLTFESFLTDEAVKILPKLVEAYRGSKPKTFALMIYALHDLSMLIQEPKQLNETHLHKALEKTFGKIGTRQAFNTNLSNFHGANFNHHKEIDKHKLKIKAL